MLGKIESVELRKIWQNEEYDFTPWLAKDENIVQLGEQLNFDIHVIKKEEKIGDYEVDLLAEEAITNEKIVIENQLEKSDHKHLRAHEPIKFY